MNIASIIMSGLFDIACIMGCGYVVFFKDANPWWFALAIVIIGMHSAAYTEE